MSGRARIYQGRHYAYIYWTGEPLQVARFEQGGRWKPVCMDGPTFKRRADAKRWLIARAAGLAEVPRGPSFGTRYGSPQTNAVVPCGPEGMSVPRGWRVVDAYVSVDEQAIVTLERNRRRR